MQRTEQRSKSAERDKVRIDAVNMRRLRASAKRSRRSITAELNHLIQVGYQAAYPQPARTTVPQLGDRHNGA